MQLLEAWLRHAALLRSARTGLLLGASRPRVGLAAAPPHALRACLVPPQMHRHLRDAALAQFLKQEAKDGQAILVGAVLARAFRAEGILGGTQATRRGNQAGRR